MSPIVPEDNNKPRKSYFILILFILIVLNVLTFCFFFFEPYVRQANIMREINSSNLKVEYETYGLLGNRFIGYGTRNPAVPYFFQCERVSAIVINGKGIIVTPQDINRISKISELPFLCNVHMSNMTMTDSLIEALRNYKKLNSLALDNVVITDHQLRQLGKISSLINFRLENSTNISEQAFIEFLEANPQLIGIDSKNAIPMTDQIALTISRLPKLEIISLGERSLTDRHIEIMSNSRFVKIILLSDCSHISDDSLQYFKRMPSLSWLNLYGTSVTSSGVAGFKSAKPACAVDGDVK